VRKMGVVSKRRGSVKNTNVDMGRRKRGLLLSFWEDKAPKISNRGTLMGNESKGTFHGRLKKEERNRRGTGGRKGGLSQQNGQAQQKGDGEPKRKKRNALSGKRGSSQRGKLGERLGETGS